MSKVRSYTKAGTALIISGLLLFGSSTAANASVDEFDSAMGITESEFVDAAVAIGTSEATARAAWDDDESRYSLVIYHEEETTVSETIPITATEKQYAAAQGLESAARANTQKTVTTSYTGKNGLGLDAYRLTLSKTWTYNGTRVWPGSVSVSPWASPSGFYSYSGITYSYDSYVFGNGNEYGGHQTVRHATFTGLSPVYVADSIYVGITGRHQGSNIVGSWKL